MTSIIHDGASAVIPANRDYDYDGALRLIESVRRAVASSDYFDGIVYGYTDSGRPAMAAAFTAAVEEMREFDALEAEFAATDDAVACAQQAESVGGAA